MGEFPNITPSFESQMNNNKVPPIKTYEFEFNQYRLFINSDGFIYVLCEHKDKAIRIINLIFVFTYLQGIECHAIRIEELEVVFNMMRIVSVGTIRANAIYKTVRDGLTPDVISLEILGDIIKKAEIFFQNNKIIDMLILYLEAHTLYKFFEASHSFFMSWLFLEKYLWYVWDIFIKENDNRIRNFKNWSDSLTIHKLINHLYKSKLLSKREYRLLMKFKEKRNSYVHDAKRIKPMDANKIKDFNLSFLKKLI